MFFCFASLPGPDNIPTQFLMAIPSKELHKLLDFYNYLWESGFPHQWCTAIVVPILKMGKPAAETGSYRPIALTSCVCKIVERMANARLRHYLKSENLIARLYKSITCYFNKEIYIN